MSEKQRTTRGLPFVLALCGTLACSTPPLVPLADAVVLTDATHASDVLLQDSPAVLDSPTMTDVAPPSDGASILPALDAGDPFVDAGSLGEPAWAALDVLTSGACPALIACGGDVVGTWDVSGGCFEVPVPAQLMSCPGASVTHSVGHARGRVTFAGGFAHRVAQWQVEVDLFVPSLCAGFVGGCTGLESLIHGSFPDSACVTSAAGDCDCAVRETGALDDADAYVTMDNQIVSATLGKRWDYCITDTQLRYRDVSPSGPLEPGIIALTRRSP